MGINFTGLDATFRTRLMGFDKEDVRVCVRNLLSDCDEARRQADRLAAKLKTLEDSGGPASTRDSVGAQVEKVLASAHRVAEEVTLESKVAARKALNEAQEEAARLRSQAENDATALTRSAHARLAELNAEIERMTERRDAVQALLDRAAGQLVEIARSMRATALAPDAVIEESSKQRPAMTVGQAPSVQSSSPVTVSEG
jgi:hypothetical protein